MIPIESQQFFSSSLVVFKIKLRNCAIYGTFKISQKSPPPQSKSPFFGYRHFRSEVNSSLNKVTHMFRNNFVQSFNDPLQQSRYSH